MITPEEFRHYVAQVGEIDNIMIDVEKAEGIYVWDTSKKEYIDMLAGICVGNIGHRNKAVIDAIKEQMDKYMHVMVYGEFVQSPQYKYAKKLIDLLPKGLDQMFIVNSGSEAIEGAIKAAKLYTKRGEIISFRNSYHGSTTAAISMISDERFRKPFFPLLPDCKYIDFNNEDDLSKITEHTACVVSEIFPVGTGVTIPQNDFIQKLRSRCNKTGTMLILDEIQTGFGRTGKLFAFEHYEIVPDLLCIAKSMGGGMPIGAFIGSDVVMNSLNNHHPLIGHATTFGGHPLSCAAALAVLNVLLSENIIEEVEAKGEYLRSNLKHPNINKVEGAGLFNSLYLKKPELWKEALVSCFEEGIITGTHLFNSGALSLKPPLTITYEELDEAIRRILLALDKI
ncbi:MAG: aminotransferase class III-fold pyridoxal phosphate-dependent enzyme [Bacteroidales bacterium]|jgi:acetylornithine/succinyldiaminopimelate/putrescine aminotransferase|nr:aminotransferase class III-fold pyridoxal phosphate-dependent enzyme [Bacteroidales bacterium]